MKSFASFRLRRIVGLAVGASVVLSGWTLSDVAHAEAYAFASSRINDFRLTGGATFLSVSTESTLTAAQWGSSSAGFNTTTFNGGASDALQASAGPGVFPAENTFVPSLLASQGARGDALTSASTIGTFPSFDNVAEARTLNQPGGGSEGRNTELTVFTLAAPSSLTISFSFAELARAFTTGLAEFAEASVANTFTIRDSTGAAVFSNSPADVNFTCNSANGVPGLGCSSAVSGMLSITTPTLSSGTYNLGVRSSSQVNVVGVSAVPEPESYALMLAGFAILGALAHRRRKT